MKPSHSILPFLALILTRFAGCGPIPESVQSAGAPGVCPTNAAIIAVTEGLYLPLCGCAEAASRPPASATVTCTVTAPVMIQFQFIGAPNQAQIIPTTTPSGEFTATPIINLRANPRYNAFAFQMKTTGTFNFVNAFNSTMTGQLIVQ